MKHLGWLKEGLAGLTEEDRNPKAERCLCGRPDCEKAIVPETIFGSIEPNEIVLGPCPADLLDFYFLYQKLHNSARKILPARDPLDFLRSVMGVPISAPKLDPETASTAATLVSQCEIVERIFWLGVRKVYPSHNTIGIRENGTIVAMPSKTEEEDEVVAEISIHRLG